VFFIDLLENYVQKEDKIGCLVREICFAILIDEDISLIGSA
jgi:hypothetical protein